MKDTLSSRQANEKKIRTNPFLKNLHEIIHMEVKIIPKLPPLFTDVFDKKSRKHIQSDPIDPMDYFQDIRDIKDDALRLVECQRRIDLLRKNGIKLTAADILDPNKVKPVEETLAHIKARFSTVANGLLNPSKLTLREYVAFVLAGGNDFTMKI